MAVVPTKGPASCNRVKNAETWKAHVRKEEKTVHQWRKGWGYLVDDYAKLSDQLQEVNDRFARQIGDDNMLAASPVEDTVTTVRQQSGRRSRRHSQPAAAAMTSHGQSTKASRTGELKLPPIDSTQYTTMSQTCHHRSKSVPQQSSGVVGWYSAVPSSLEIYNEPYIPKGDLVKIFKWPREGLPNP